MGRKIDDLSGKRFGKLLVVELAAKLPNNSNVRWSCICDCGEIKTVFASGLRGGTTTSCGCFRSESLTVSNTKHGLSKTTEYRIWYGMHRRCYDSSHESYNSYGGRGINVCPEWMDFETFLLDMRTRPEDKTLDRLNNDIGYSKENCRWATVLEQANNKRKSIYHTVDGITKTQADWARDIGITRAAMSQRIKSGMPVSDACTKLKQN